jgi:hypothetical protein
MDNQADFERRAAQCRRLSGDVIDTLTSDRLIALAEEFEAKAKAAAATPPKT